MADRIVMPRFAYGDSMFDAATKGLEQGQKEYDRETLFEIGKRAMQGDWGGAQSTAFSRGNMDAGFKIQSHRDSRTDRARANSDRQRELERKIATDAASIFQNFIDKEADPARRTALTQQFISAHPEMGPRLKRYGVDVGNPETVSAFFRAQAQGYQDPMEAEKQRLGLELTRAQIAATNQKAAGGSQDDTPAGRASLAASLGLDPNSDGYKSYVMTGKLPREDQQMLTATDKKAILEADEVVASTQGAMESLKRARQLSGKAYDGMLAGERGWLMSQFGSDAGNATRELNQTVTEGALQQLKAIFGGMPTEGERKVLLEIAGSAEMPEEVRNSIYDRAMQLAERRLRFNQDRAQQMRGGTYYKPAGEQGTPQPAPGGLGGSPLRARNDQTGEVIEWDGQQWVPVQ